MKKSFFRHSLCHVVLLVVFSVGLIAFPVLGIAQQESIAKEKTSLTPKTDMLKKILENSKWGAVDRPQEALYEVDQQLQQVRRKIKSLRAALITSSSKADESKLQDYVAISEELAKMKAEIEKMQVNVTSCKTICSKKELAAAEGKEPPKTEEKAPVSMQEAEKAFGEYKKSLANLKKLSEKVGDNNLKGLALELENGLKDVEKAMEICGECMGDMDAQKPPRMKPRMEE
jgi:hypothetical protein